MFFDGPQRIAETAPMTPSPVALVPPAYDLLDWAAERIAAAHRGALPDLSRLTLIVPTPAAIQPLRSRLLRHAGGALLGPQISTLAGFADARGMEEPALSTLDCRLMLAQALENYTHLFQGQDAVALADEFFGLFEELSAQAPELAEDPRCFLARIEKAYGVQLAQISQEAQRIHTLWRAFLAQSAGRSPGVVYARALRSAFSALAADERVYLIGFDHLAASECAAVRAALAAGQATLWLQGRLGGRDGAALAALCTKLRAGTEIIESGPEPRTQWLDALFDLSDAALRERMQAPPASAPRAQAADNPEHEARIADLAIRQWLLQGRRDIAVVTQDRRLARRLRALLERARVPMRDEVGWALSTSAAAASLVHWLDACEENFHYHPLLDLLKSAFFDPAQEHAPAVWKLEQRIYLSGTLSGLSKLSQLDETARTLLKSLEQAARLLTLSAGARPAHYWCESLLQSLRALPLWRHWQHDDAGSVLCGVLEDLHAALRRNGLHLDWSTFRRLLEHTLERATFRSEAAHSRVRLLTLEQARGLHCDALIIAGASVSQFPGKPAAQPLFNHAVRAELGLPHWAQQQQLALARFRVLLQAAPEVLITWAPESEGEPAQPCAWVQALQTCGARDAAALADLAGSHGTEVAGGGAEAPAPLSAPRPAAPAALLPVRLSASAHQSLIDCPYQFFAAYCLGLRAPDEPDQPFSRRDFGTRVHTILQAFHQQQPKLPPPFAEAVNAANKAAAAARLEELARAVFAGDLRTRALAQAWLAEFLDLIPPLLDWLAQRSSEWRQVRAEDDLRRELAPGLSVDGRIDRLERRADGASCIVDYKTGAAPKAADVQNGEAVQATHYALLDESCTRVEYLLLQREAKAPVVVEGAELDQARAGVRGRLLRVYEHLRAGAAMPAQGDEASCAYCSHKGLCRKGAWADG